MKGKGLGLSVTGDPRLLFLMRKECPKLGASGDLFRDRKRNSKEGIGLNFLQTS
jgi:hypothetical protein